MITLAYPNDVTPLQTITLRSPALGDSEQLNLKTGFKQSMAGTVSSNKRTDTVTKLLLTFNALERSEIEALKSFYRNAVGQPIVYTAPDTTTWTGRFGNDSLQITTARDGCSYSVILELLCA